MENSEHDPHRGADVPEPIHLTPSVSEIDKEWVLFQEFQDKFNRGYNESLLGDDLSNDIFAFFWSKIEALHRSEDELCKKMQNEQAILRAQLKEKEESCTYIAKMYIDLQNDYQQFLDKTIREARR